MSLTRWEHNTLATQLHRSSRSATAQYSETTRSSNYNIWHRCRAAFPLELNYSLAAGSNLSCHPTSTQPISKFVFVLEVSARFSILYCQFYTDWEIHSSLINGRKPSSVVVRERELGHRTSRRWIKGGGGSSSQAEAELGEPLKVDNCNTITKFFFMYTRQDIPEHALNMKLTKIR